jgi:hypothetical protein
MANPDDCEKYPDIYQTPKGSKDEIAKINAENLKNERIYMAVKHVLEGDFDFKPLPQDPQDFPGTLKGKDKAQVVAILGLIHADNWEDPSNGKVSANTDDAVVKGAGKDDYFVIDRRFIDAVVDAVKEYTASSELYNNVFDLMLAEAAEGVLANRPPSKAT